MPVLASTAGSKAALPVAQLLGNLSRTSFGWSGIGWRHALLFSLAAVRGDAVDVIVERSFHGRLHEQARNARRYIERNALRRKIVKSGGRAEATRILNYPFPAVEKSLVNAVYHRGYDQREPVEVRINPDGIEILSYPGPDASIRLEALAGEKIIARRYRNRRIGEFLKELDLTEGRSTGILKIRKAMETNGSPPPRSSTDEGRTYFLVELPVHQELAGVKAHDEAHQELTEAKILSFVSGRPRSRPEIAEHLGQKGRSGHLYRSIDRLRSLGFVELTLPDKPQSRNQRIRIAENGVAWLASR